MPERALSLKRRDFLRASAKISAATLAILVCPVGRGASATSILAVRVWPAADYTRVTLEYSDTLKFSQFLLKDPYRLVVDLDGVEFNSVLQSLPNKISESDPYIKLIRAGRFKPGVVRLVIELKAEVRPEIF